MNDEAPIFRPARAEKCSLYLISPQDVGAHHYLGHAYHDQQLYADAIASFSSATSSTYSPVFFQSTVCTCHPYAS